MIAQEQPPMSPESSPGARAFGLTIRGRRLGAGLTLRACAERMGITMTLLSYYEQGRLDMPAAHQDLFNSAVRQGSGKAACRTRDKAVRAALRLITEHGSRLSLEAMAEALRLKHTGFGPATRDAQDLDAIAARWTDFHGPAEVPA